MRTKIFLSLYAVVLLGAIYRFNPKLFSKEPLIESAPAENQIWNTVHLGELAPDASGSRPVFYRQSLQHEARFSVASLKFDLESVWKTEKLNVGVHKASKASVVGDDAQIYVGSDSSWFYAFDKAGKLNWKVFLGDSARGVHSTAAVDGNSVYIGSYRGTLYRLNKTNGEIIWMKILGQTIGASPILEGESITVAVEVGKPDGYLMKLNKNNGELIWKSPSLGEQAHSSPSLDVERSILVCGANNSTLQGFDFKTGKRLWTTHVKGAVKSTITLHEGVGYATTWGKELVAFQIETGQILWKVALNSKSQVSPVVLPRSKQVFAADMSGSAYGIDISTGNVNWKMSSQMVRQLSSPVVLTDGKTEKVFFYCEEKTMCLIDPSGIVERKWPVGADFTGSPFFDNKFVFFSYDEGELEAFQIQSARQ